VVLDPALVVAGEAPVSHEPAECALDDPAALHDLEGMRAGPQDDSERDVVRALHHLGIADASGRPCLPAVMRAEPRRDAERSGCRLAAVHGLVGVDLFATNQRLSAGDATSLPSLPIPRDIEALFNRHSIVHEDALAVAAALRAASC
jgi:hypothetical protein